MRGKFGRAVFGVFAEFEAVLLRTIEPEDDSFTDLDRLVLMAEFHPALQIVEVRCHCLFDRFPSRLGGLNVPTCTRARIQVLQVEPQQCVKDILSDVPERHRRKQSVGRPPAFRKEVRVRRQKLTENRQCLVAT